MTATIEAEDTVRFVGRRTRWEVTEVNADGTVELYGSWGNPRRGGARTIQRSAGLDQIELIRKGNAGKDAIDKFIAEYDARPVDVEAETRRAAERDAAVVASRLAREARAERDRKADEDEAMRVQVEAERVAREAVEIAEYNARMAVALEAHGGDYLAALLSTVGV